MNKCPRCGRVIVEEETCPSCGLELFGERAEKITRLESYDKKIKQVSAIFLLSMFGIWIIPFRNIKLVLAIISFLILPVLIFNYVWKRKRLREDLGGEEEIDFEEKLFGDSN